MNIVVVDYETGGYNPQENPILQYALKGVYTKTNKTFDESDYVFPSNIQKYMKKYGVQDIYSIAPPRKDFHLKHVKV